MGHLIHDTDWPDVKKMLAAFRSGLFLQRGPSSRPFPEGRPNIRAVLLEDLESGATVSAAVTRLEETNEVQVIDIKGTATGGTFTLLYGSSNASRVITETEPIPYNASAAEVRAALESLSAFQAGDLIVTGYPLRWVVEFTGQFAGSSVELLSVTNSITGVYNTITVTAGLQWVDANRTEDIHCQMPLMSPTPLKGGAVVSAGWFPEARGRYCVLNLEPRDLEYVIDEDEPYSYVSS